MKLGHWRAGHWFEANGRNLRAADFHRQSAAPAAETAAGAYARARVPY